MVHNTPAFGGIKVGFVGSAWTTEDNVNDDNGCRNSVECERAPHLPELNPVMQSPSFIRPQELM